MPTPHYVDKLTEQEEKVLEHLVGEKGVFEYKVYLQHDKAKWRVRYYIREVIKYPDNKDMIAWCKKAILGVFADNRKDDPWWEVMERNKINKSDSAVHEDDENYMKKILDTKQYFEYVVRTPEETKQVLRALGHLYFTRYANDERRQKRIKGTILGSMGDR
tara:strand:+ start:2314 stop:2796 length:483 start_codon:yes stop_codon:yes gene_type:complete